MICRLAQGVQTTKVKLSLVHKAVIANSLAQGLRLNW